MHSCVAQRAHVTWIGTLLCDWSAGARVARALPSHLECHQRRVLVVTSRPTPRGKPPLIGITKCGDGPQRNQGHDGASCGGSRAE